MLGSTIIDVSIGLVLAFLGVSLAASAITEAVSSFLNLRHTTLLSGIQALLNDKNFDALAKDLYNHALVNPLSDGKVGVPRHDVSPPPPPSSPGTSPPPVALSSAPQETPSQREKKLTSMPAYIQTKQFVTAFLDIIKKNGVAQGAAYNDVAGAIGKIQDPQIKAAVNAMWVASVYDIKAFEGQLGLWFDNAMDRVAGIYKKYTQGIGFGFALLVAVAFNINAIHITTVLWQKPAIITQVDVASVNKDSSADEILTKLEASTLVGWSTSPVRGDLAGVWWYLGWAEIIAGWVAIAAGSLFGAPFWFDALSRLVRLRGTGAAASKTKSK